MVRYRNVRLDQIDLTERQSQCRAHLNDEAIADYTDTWIDNGPSDKFKFDKSGPIILVCDGDRYYIGDGWHRVFAALKAGRKTVPAEVRSGNLKTATEISLGANEGQGLRRTQADRVKAIYRALKVFPGWTDQKIAKEVNASPSTIKSYRIKEQDQAKKDAKGRGEPVPFKPVEPDMPVEPARQEAPSRPRRSQAQPPVPTPVADAVVEVAQEVSEELKQGSVNELDKQIHSAFGAVTRLIDKRLDKSTESKQYHHTVLQELKAAYNTFLEWRKSG